MLGSLFFGHLPQLLVIAIQVILVQLLEGLGRLQGLLPSCDAQTHYSILQLLFEPEATVCAARLLLVITCGEAMVRGGSKNTRGFGAVRKQEGGFLRAEAVHIFIILI